MGEFNMVVSRLCKRYDGFALKDVSFKLPKGCIMGFIGENGAGKSTTIKLILDIINKDSGSVELLDGAFTSKKGRLNGATASRCLEDIGVVFDEGCFPEEMNAADISRAFSHIYRQWDTAQYDSLLNRLAVPKNKAFKEMSRGMKMKLSIAAAMSHNARLLIMDEATSGLDPLVRDGILDLFMEFIQDESRSIFLSSHIISDLEKICDYITFIHNGEIVLSEEKDVLLEKYALLKCSREQLSAIIPAAVAGLRRHSFGVEALVETAHVPAGLPLERVSLEEMMILMIKGERLC